MCWNRADLYLYITKSLFIIDLFTCMIPYKSLWSFLTTRSRIGKHILSHASQNTITDLHLHIEKSFFINVLLSSSIKYTLLFWKSLFINFCHISSNKVLRISKIRYFWKKSPENFISFQNRAVDFWLLNCEFLKSHSWNLKVISIVYIILSPKLLHNYDARIDCNFCITTGIDICQLSIFGKRWNTSWCWSMGDWRICGRYYQIMSRYVIFLLSNYRFYSIRALKMRHYSVVCKDKCRWLRPKLCSQKSGR